MKKSFLQQYWFAVLAAILGFAIIGVVGYQYWEKSQIPVMKKMGDFTLENMNGTPFTFSESNGKVRLVSFIFTNCPDVCPATTYYMSTMQEELKTKGLFGSEVSFLTISFDSERDTPEVLQKYAEKFKADQSGWAFLRGDQQTVEKVTKSFGIGVLKQPDGQYIHTMRTFLIDKDGNMRRAYGMGADMNVEQIMGEMELLAD